MAAVSVMYDPSYTTFYNSATTATVSEIPVVATTTINAYRDALSNPVNLTLGATQDVRIESVGSTSMYVMQGQSVNLFETSVTDGLRSDYNMLTVTNASNTSTVIKPTSENRVVIQGGDNLNTVGVSGMTLNLSGGYQLFSTTNPNGFRMSKALDVMGDITTPTSVVAGGDVRAGGDMFAQSYNMYKNLVDSNLSQVAYAFYINDYNQLELLRYYLYTSSNTSRSVQERVMTFGTATYNVNGEKDLPISSLSNYTKLDSFNNLVPSSSNGGGSSGGGGSSSSYVFLNSSGNLYINEGQFLGIGNTDPIYELDVTGTIRATTQMMSPQYLVTSDQRLKENIKLITDLNSSLDLIKKLNVYNFNFKSDPEKTTRTGFIAQEVKRLIPTAVKTVEFAGLSNCMQIDTDIILAYLVAAVKALAIKVSM